MKKFFKTLIGKISLIILFVLFSLCFAFTASCQLIDYQSDMFQTSKEVIIEDLIDSHVNEYMRQIALRDINGEYNKLYDFKEFLTDYKYEIIANKKIEYSGSGGNNSLAKNLVDVNNNHTFYIDKDTNELCWNYKPESNYFKEYEIILTGKVDTSLNPLLSFEIKSLTLAYSIKYYIYPICVISLLIMIALFIALMWSAGRRSEDEQFHNSVLFVLPFDILLLISAGFICLSAVGAIREVWRYELINYLLFLGILSEVIFLIICMEFTNRVKTKKLLDTCLLFRLFAFIFNILLFIPKELFKVLRNIIDGIRKYSIVKKVLFILLIYEIFEFNLFEPSDVLGVWVFKAIIIIPLVLYITISFKKIEDGVDRMSNGDFDSKIDNKHLHGSFKKLSKQINNLSSGMSKAVNEKVKSEKMKTELITNVTHDIKTPLTSIINYTDLISKEKTNKKVKEYSEVLLRQSNKLKRLIDDLVEVSKASTGNLDVELVDSDITTLLSQVEGEYSDKLNQSSLSIVINYPTEPIMIKADPRRMWRIFDNLMNNICKYSQSDTRVYLSCEKKDDYACIYFKNTSKDSLNIDPKELRERFVRGESSRNTDGNGLGLSIVESLTELQGGKFDIKIDGDLFKAILKFPIIK